ncbi:MAG: tetratricopeptide repeat protein [Thermoanaerobaculales bacterium]|jgi:Flp pilus assembly protein TadD|nr:tetratricopeptide repeat protein [Thermoanaerobaculales bacterium]
MTIRTTTKLTLAVVILVVAAVPAIAEEPPQAVSDNEVPAGLTAFLEARLLESQDRYREALAAYDRALREDGSVVEVRVGLANLLFRVGMAERAVAVLDGVEDLDWHGRRVYALALAQYSMQEPDRMDQALAALTEVREERDDDPSLSLALGQLLHRLGRVDEAEVVIAELRQSRPGSPQLISYHASLLLQLHRREEAAEAFAQCAASPLTMSSCRDQAVELLIELDRPGEAADVLAATLGDDELDQRLRAAYLYWDAGRPSEALDLVDSVLRKVPDSERARTLKAHLLSAAGQFSEASAEFRRLAKKNPDDVELKLSLAWSLARMGDLDQARRWLDRAWELVADDAGSAMATRCAVSGSRIELVADNPLVAREWLARVADPSEAGEDYVRLLGETYRREENWTDGISALIRLQPHLAPDARLAAEAIEAEFRIRSSDPRAWSRLRPLLDSDEPEAVLAGLQVLQATDRWSDAQREAETARERFPDDREILFVQAASLERLNRFDEAEAAFLELIEGDPTDANAANYLGYLWADRGVRLDEALELINLAVSLDPENAAYLDSLGWVHYRLGAMEEAEYWLRRAIEINDGDGTLLAHLGEVLVVRGQVEEGIRYLRLGLDLGCEDPDHVRSLLDELRDEAVD